MRKIGGPASWLASLRFIGMLYEVRDYHYRPDLFEAYKTWAEKAVPVLKEQLDVVGFWIDSGQDVEIRGKSPSNAPIGYANVTWIIRWQDREDREANLRPALSAKPWRDVWAEHPDPGGYLQMVSRFMEAI